MRLLLHFRLNWPVLAGVLAIPLEAQVVAYDGFGEYAAGTQVESGATGSAGIGMEGGIGWGGAYDVNNAVKHLVKIENRSSNPVVYGNGEVVITGGNRALRFSDNANGSYVVQRPLATAFSAAAGETLWFSLLFRTASDGASPLATQDFFQVGFDNNANASSGNPRVSIGANTLSTTVFPSDYHFFVRSTTSVANSDFDSSFPIMATTTYLLVGRIQPNAGIYDSVSLFVNPSSLSDPGPPSASVTVPSGLTTLSHAFIRTAFLDNGDAYVLDEWFVGRDYGSVVPSLRNALRIIPPASPGGSPWLRWPVWFNGVVLQTSPTLAPESWTDLTGPFPLNAAEYEFPVPIEPGVPQTFYRLRRF